MKHIFFSALLMSLSWIAQAADKPNVVLIMADDMGYGDLACNGNPIIQTPELDQLAGESVRLEDFHAYPYCVPARASLLTGLFADKTGVHNRDTGNWFVRSDHTMISTLFKQAGYTTGMFGKWHLGDNHPYGPESRDFDEVVRHFGGAISVVGDHWDNDYEDDHYYHNGQWKPYKGYCTDVFFDEAQKFVDRAVKEDKPFFLYLPTNAPHGPYIVPPKYSKAYEGKFPPGVPVGLQNFYAMITNLDENVGKLRRHLENIDQAGNTLFIFTTDNGTALGDAVFNAGMTGHKGSVREGGHRVPLFLHWPGGGMNKEKRIETLTNITDIVPTLADLCSVEIPEDLHFDGQSLRPLLEQDDSAPWPDRILMTSEQRGIIKKWQTTVVMTERWRLINNGALFDIQADPRQTNNVYKDHPEVARRLSAWYDRLWHEEIEPGIDMVAEIPVGTDHSDEVILTYHDCCYKLKGWYQDRVRFLFKPWKTPLPERAFWPVHVDTPGTYRIELRRWPVEADQPIRSMGRPSPTVYGQNRWKRESPGVAVEATSATLTIGEQTKTVPVGAEDKAAVFHLTLPQGSTRLSAHFNDGQRDVDAYFVHVIKTD